MKQLFLLFAAVLMTVSVMAESVSVQLADGRVMKGTLISYNEEMVAVEPNTFVKYKQTFSPSEVVYFDIEKVGRVKSINGKFVLDELTRIIPEEEPVIESNTSTKKQVVLPSNPNVVVGNAMRTCGKVTLGVGIPALVVGSILVAVGNTGNYGNTINIERAKCATAGYVLMPFGAALTVVGVPLCIEGKRIAQINFNYTGNGAGVAVNF